MANEKILNTRIITKHADWAAWQESTLPLKEGEVVLAKVLASETDAAGRIQEVPAYIAKVGINGKTFKESSWMYAKAVDVYGWAKKEHLEVADMPILDFGGEDEATDIVDSIKKFIAAEIAKEAELRAEGDRLINEKLGDLPEDFDTFAGYIDSKVTKVDGKGLSTNDLTDELKSNYDAAYAHTLVDHAPADAQANIIETVKVNGEALTITDKAVDIIVGALADKDEVAKSDLAEALATEIDSKVASVTAGDASVTVGGTATAPTIAAKISAAEGNAITLAEDGLKVIIPESTKVEASATNGNIKVDGEEVTVYTHPDQHIIADINGLQNALDGKSDDGHKHVKADIEDFTHNHEMSEVNGLADALAAKQDVIPDGTYDAYGSAAQALTDARAYVDEEDKFVTDILTVDKFGGIAAGSDLNGMTTHEILNQLLYPYIAFTINSSSRSAAAATLENGASQTLTSATISVTKKSKPITSIKLLNGSTVLEEKTGDAVAAGGTITFSNLGITVTKDNNPNLKFTVTDGTTSTDKNVGASIFVYPYYMGECTANAAIDETLIEGLTKKVESKGNKTVTHSCENGRMVIAYPKAHGVLKSILDPNNFETIGDYTRSEVPVTGLDGTTQTYYVYASGAATVSGFKVQYKY